MNAVVNPEVEVTQSWVKHLVWYLRRLQRIRRGVVAANDSHGFLDRGAVQLPGAAAVSRARKEASSPNIAC